MSVIRSVGKIIVAVSQYSDWLLAIYEDEAGATHLEARGNYADYPEVIGNVPPGTGWRWISAGKDHALALNSNGTLFSWGRNTSGQLNLPTNVSYSRVEAGDGFSLGMSPEGRISAAGKDDYGQVSGPASFTGVAHIAIAAGTDRAAVIGPDGQLHIVGKPLPGVQPQKLGNFTDVALINDVAFALRESAPEKHAGPISPGSAFHLSLDGSGTTIPWGSSIDHTVDGVIRAFDPASTQLFWVNEKEETQVLFAQDSEPASLIHFVPSGSRVNAREDYRTTVSPPAASNAPDFTVNAGEWLTPYHQSLPGAICFADRCSASAGAKKHDYLTDPLSLSSTNAGSGIPVLSVNQLSETEYGSTLGILGSNNPADSRTITVDKENVDPNQPISFVITTGNWGHDPGTKVELTAQANLTVNGSAMDYQITATASQAIPAMNITPKVWQETGTGDVLVYTGPTEVCTGRATCVATGNYTPSDVTTYFANATVLYSVSSTMPNGVAEGMLYGISTPNAMSTASSIVPLRENTWQAHWSHIAVAGSWFVYDTAGLSQYVISNVQHSGQYQYYQNIYIDADAYTDKTSGSGSVHYIWDGIEKSGVTILSKSRNLDLLANTNPNYAGGAPIPKSHAENMARSALIEIIVEITTDVLSTAVPPFGHVFTAANIVQSLIQAITPESGNVWTVTWDHTNIWGTGTTETEHFLNIETFTISDTTDEQNSGCAAATFDLDDETWFSVVVIGQDTTLLDTGHAFTRDKILKGTTYFNDKKYTFAPNVSVSTWEESMEAF